MNKAQFQDWKQAHQWLWDHLNKAQQELLDQLALVGPELALANAEQQDNLARVALKLRTRAEVLQEIAELEYEDIFEQEVNDDEDNSTG
jgi:hypothetical protein